MKKIIFSLVFFVCIKSSSQTSTKSLNSNPPPALSAIRESDLKHDLYYLASDSMRGRRAGTLDELRATAWVAQQAQKEGLKPAGDGGTYFQFFPLQRMVVADNSDIKVNGSSLRLWKDVWVTEPIEASLNGTVVWLNSLADTSRPEINGSIVAMKILPPSPMP